MEVPPVPKTEEERDAYVFGMLCGAHFVYSELGKDKGLEGLIDRLGRLAKLSDFELVIEISNFVKEGLECTG